MGAVVTVRRVQRNGKKAFTVKVVETGASTGTIWDTSGVYPAGIPQDEFPPKGLIWFQWDGNAGQPRLGKGGATWNDAKALEQVRVTPAADQTYTEDGPFPYTLAPDQAGILYGNSKFTSGSSNAGNWLITVTED